MLPKIIILCFLIGSIQAQEFEYANILTNFLESDGFQNLQKLYTAIPKDIRDKIHEDILSNPGRMGKMGQDVLTMVGPQLQNILSGLLKNNNNPHGGFSGNLGAAPGGSPQTPGFDFSNIANMVGHLITFNPEMMVTMFEGVMSGNGINYEKIVNLMAEKLDMETILSLASTLRFDDDSIKTGPVGEDMDEDDMLRSTQANILEILKENQIYQKYEAFTKSTFGKKVSYLLPRVLKAKTVPDVLRLIEKETSVRFDTILMQMRDKTVRKILVKQMIQPVTNFLRSMYLPDNVKQLITKTDDLLNNQLGLDVTVNWVEPIVAYIRDRFKITRESLLHLTPEDVEHIIQEVLNDELFDPLNVVLGTYTKVKGNYECRNFIFCQLNYNYYGSNLVRYNIVKFSSIATAFQVKRNEDDFVNMYNSVYNGADGKDCTMGITAYCLDLMETASHNEL